MQRSMRQRIAGGVLTAVALGGALTVPGTVRAFPVPLLPRLAADSASVAAPVVPPPFFLAAPEESLAVVVLRSEPEGTQVTVDGWGPALVPPVEIRLDPGRHVFRAGKRGFEPLEFETDLAPGKRVTMRFLLRQEEPFPLTAEDLGLEYQPVIPLLTEEAADLLRERYNRVAQTFAVVPLSQGMVAKAVVGNTAGPGADGLILSGALLTAGSYFLGKILASRKRTWIRRQNQDIEISNADAVEHNKRVDEIVRQRNSERRTRWMTANANRGRVEVTGN